MLRPLLINVGDLMCLIGVCTPSAQQSRFSKTVFWMNKWTKERRNILLLHHFVRHSHPPWDFNTKFIIYFPHHLLLTTSMTTAPMRSFQPLILMCLDFYGDKWMIPNFLLASLFSSPTVLYGLSSEQLVYLPALLHLTTLPPDVSFDQHSPRFKNQLSTNSMCTWFPFHNLISTCLPLLTSQSHRRFLPSSETHLEPS